MEKMGREFLVRKSQLEPIFHNHSHLVGLLNVEMDDRGREVVKRLVEFETKREMSNFGRKMVHMLVKEYSK